jgi:hypothetical protein
MLRESTEFMGENSGLFSSANIPALSSILPQKAAAHIDDG